MKKLLYIFLLLLSFNCLSKDINLVCKGKNSITINPIGEPIEKIQVSSKFFTETISIINNVLIKSSNGMKTKKYVCLVTPDGIICPNYSIEKLDELQQTSQLHLKNLEMAALEPNAKVPSFPEFYDDHFLLIINRYSGVMTNIQSYAEFSPKGKKTILAENKEGICESAKLKF